MIFIHHTSCISPQHSFGEIDLNTASPAREGKLFAQEPDYSGIPPGVLRRMGKAVRMGVGAALPLLQHTSTLDGIIMGTANGGMEDCILFLNQIIQYEEGLLTPGNFVQSTPNAIAAQIGLLSRNKGYNITYVHRGLAFEEALTDAMMQIEEHPADSFLLGSVEEISTYNYNIEWLGGWYKTLPEQADDLFYWNTPGSIAGEGAALFIINGKKAGAIASVYALETFHSSDKNKVKERWEKFIQKNANEQPVDLLISGENGDNRLLDFYQSIEESMNQTVDLMRFKQLCGEYPTASSFGVWLACQLHSLPEIPAGWFKYPPLKKSYSNIAIYNNYKGLQHSFILLNLLK